MHAKFKNNKILHEKQMNFSQFSNKNEKKKKNYSKAACNKIKIFLCKLLFKTQHINHNKKQKWVFRFLLIFLHQA